MKPRRPRQGQKSEREKSLKGKIFFYFLFLVFAFVLVSGVNAQSVSPASTSTILEGIQIIEQPLGLPSTDIRLIIANIIKVALSLIGIIMVILMLYGGFLWMTAGGNEEQIGKAKKVLINAVIGLIIILSAYSIVLFVMKMLGIDVGTGNGPQYGSPYTQHLSGSGALGRTVKDHYPERDQKDVARNAKIIITFFKPVLPSSFIEDKTEGSAANKIYGNCKTGMQSWVNDCDRVKTVGGKLSDNIINIKETKTGKSIEAAAIVATTNTINGITGVYTIVIRPLTDTQSSSGGYLGSATEKIDYTVYLGKEILLDDPANPNSPAFKKEISGDDNYNWRFITDTKLDTTPPYIKSVYPGNNDSTAKNTVIQVDFNEAMDPTGIQGSFSSSSAAYYVVRGNNIYLVASSSQVPQGSFDLSNGYRTLEFTSTKVCGKNACGKDIYCLPVCDKVGATCSEDKYDMLLRTGTTINSTTFESIPFTGFMDVCGNALDSNINNKIDIASGTMGNFPIYRGFDNYNWDFTVKDEIDSTSPYLRQVIPGLDASWVTTTQEWSMVFSKRMRVAPMYGIGIEEVPTGNVSMWKVPRVSLPVSSPHYTTTTMEHGWFLLKTDYYPILTSDIEDVNYNCFYPGLGPKQKADSLTKLSLTCDGQNNCCAVSSSSPDRAFCCNGAVNSNSSSTTSCLNKLKAEIGN